MPRGPEETWGHSGSSSEQQDAQLVTCGQGIRDSCVHSLPLEAGPAGEPSLPVNAALCWRIKKKKSPDTLPSKYATSFNGAPVQLKLIIKEVDMKS